MVCVHVRTCTCFFPCLADVQVGLDLARIVQQARQKAGLNQRELAAVSHCEHMLNWLICLLILANKNVVANFSKFIVYVSPGLSS